jgi:hypothetical protein
MPNVLNAENGVKQLIWTRVLDHVVVLNEESLRRHVKAFVQYYHETRTHLSLEKDTPAKRSVQPPGLGQGVALPQVGGLHHRYERRVA